MATATTSEGGVVTAIVDVLTAVVSGVIFLVTGIAQGCLQIAVACPALAVGLEAFIGACYVPLEATPEAIQPWLERAFPMIAGAGAAFATLMVMGSGGSTESS